MLPNGIYLTSDTVSTNYWAENSGNIYRESGNFGLGNNNPQETLDVAGRLHLRQTTAPVNPLDRLYNVNGDLFWNGHKMGENFWTKTDNDIALNLSGNVGIGVASPTTKLDIAGTVKATSFFDATNNVYLIPNSINGNYWSQSGGNLYREMGDVALGSNDANGYRLNVTGNVYGSGNLVLSGTIDTGQGATELYAMDQNVLTTSNPTFLGLNLTGNAQLNGNVLSGNTTASGNLTLSSTANATKGKIVFGNSVYDEVNNRLGIGTTSPGSYGLYVLGSARVSSNFISNRIYADSAGTVSLPSFSFNGDQNTGMWSPSGDVLALSTADAERVRIDSAGNVGIGTTDPNVKLDVRGKLQVGNSGNTGSSNWPLYISDTFGLGWKVADGAGITKFELYTGNGGLNEMRLFNGVKIIGSGQDLTLGTTNNVSALTIKNNANGNVGIGTTSPGAKLEIFGATSPQVKISYDGSNSTTLGTSSSGGFTIIPSGGIANVDLGTNSGAFVVRNNYAGTLQTLKMTNIQAAGAGVGSSFGFYGTAGSNTMGRIDSQWDGSASTDSFMSFSTRGTNAVNEVMRLTSTGNVGIGTTTPYGKLNISGAPVASVNYGTLSVGGGAFDGITAGKFVGSGNGTSLAVNELVGFAGKLIDAQVNGTSYFSVTTAGIYSAAGNFQTGSRGNILGSANFSVAGIPIATIANGTHSQSTGFQAMLAITPTYNQTASTAANTDLLINRTQTAVGSGAQRLIDAQVGGASKFYVDSIGRVGATSTIYASSFGNISGGSINFEIYGGAAKTGSLGSTALTLIGTTQNQTTAGTQIMAAITPVYNQAASTSANTDLLINRTETAVGSGAQYLIDAQVGGVSKFRVDNTGMGYFASGIYVGATQLAVPDYVFENDYNLMSLTDLQAYVGANKHLPGIPDMAQIQKDGLNYSNMLMSLLQKTEENVLYAIQNNAQLATTQSQVAGLQAQNASLSLKTDQNITTVQQLQTSVDEQLGVVQKSLAAQTQSIASVQTKIDDHETRIAANMQNIDAQTQSIASLQQQIDELKKINNQELNVAQIDANTTDIDYLKLLLGADQAKNPGDINILGQLSAAKTETGSLVIKVVDDKNPTIGKGVILAGATKALVATKAVLENSNIFVTVRNADKAVPIKVGAVVAGQNFEVQINDLLSSDVSFDWWIVEVK